MKDFIRLKLADFPPRPEDSLVEKIIEQGLNRGVAERPSYIFPEPITFSEGGEEYFLYHGADPVVEAMIGFANEDKTHRVELRLFRQSDRTPTSTILKIKNKSIDVNTIGFDLIISDHAGRRIEGLNGTRALAWGMYLAPLLIQSRRRRTDEIDYIALDWEAGGENSSALNSALEQGKSLIDAIKTTWSYKRIADMFGFTSIEGIVYMPANEMHSLGEDYQIIVSRNSQDERIPMVISEIGKPNKVTFIK